MSLEKSQSQDFGNLSLSIGLNDDTDLLVLSVLDLRPKTWFY